MDERPLSLLFVCLGNICRSPMAAGMAQIVLTEEITVESAGIAPYGGGAAPEAVEVMKSEFNIDISGHRSRGVDDTALDTFDIIIAMDAHVHAHLKDNYRVNQERLIRWDITDPFLRGPEAFRVCAHDIAGRMEEIRGMVERHRPCEA